MRLGTYMTTALMLLTGAVGAFLLVSGKIMPKQPPEPNRDVSELCKELEYELSQQYVLGMISQEDVNRIINRCYNTK